MAEKLRIAACILLVLAAASAKLLAQSPGGFSLDDSPLPQPTRPVNDFAGVLTPTTVDALNRKIKDFKDRTDPPVVLAVAIVRTTGERDIFSYSLAVARGWKVGTDKDDNPSALLFIAVDDRKYFTQVSRDLEDELPDGLAGQLQRKHLVPAFRQGDYDKGVSDTIDAYIAAISQKTGVVEPTKEARAPRPVEDEGWEVSDWIGVCIGVAFILFVAFLNSRRSGQGFLLSLLAIFLSGRSSGGGSGWSGGGGGGGDFGGFSGGDFGGGGAGGDW